MVRFPFSTPTLPVTRLGHRGGLGLGLIFTEQLNLVGLALKLTRTPICNSLEFNYAPEQGVGKRNLSQFLS